MLTLGLETSTHSGGAALIGEQGLLGSVCFTTKQLYSQRLLPSVEWLLERTQVQVPDIKTIGVAIGPGSFTGLRIGLSVAKALAYSSGAQIVGVGTMEALAVRAAAGRNALVCPLLDARQGQVYGALYRVEWDVEGLPRVTLEREEWAGPVDEVIAWIKEPVIFAGDALPLAQAQIRPFVGDNFLMPSPHRTLPHPEEVALLASARAAEGQVDNLMALEPRYVRQSYMQRP